VGVAGFAELALVTGLGNVVGTGEPVQVGLGMPFAVDGHQRFEHGAHGGGALAGDPPGPAGAPLSRRRAVAAATVADRFPGRDGRLCLAAHATTSPATGLDRVRPVSATLVGHTAVRHT